VASKEEVLDMLLQGSESGRLYPKNRKPLVIPPLLVVLLTGGEPWQNGQNVGRIARWKRDQKSACE